MSEENHSRELDMFKEAITSEDINVALDATKHLPLLAAALGESQTRSELLPYLSNLMDMLSEELQFNVAEQLEKFVPLVGGTKKVNEVLDILLKMSSTDEIIIRERAIQAMKGICESMGNEQCENYFFPNIEKLAESEWFASKCTATALFPVCYPKMSLERQMELKDIFRNLIQSESPMVRRYAEKVLLEFIPLLDIEEIKSDFVPVFHNLSQDDQDSVKVLAVDVGIAIAKQLRNYEIHEFLLETFETLSTDYSWRVRQRVAFRIHDIQEVAGVEKNREEILEMFDNLGRDEEVEVRVMVATNFYKFTANLRESFTEDFESKFVENLMPIVHLLITDDNDEVRLALSSNILSLSSILSNECFNQNLLPLITDALENESSMKFKENMLKDLDTLPQNIDITKTIKSISNVFRNLIENSQEHWRTRRSLLIGFLNISRNTTREFFDKNLKIYYLELLQDKVYAIRRTTPLILPLLIKKFGMQWANGSLIPLLALFSKDTRYSYKYVTLFIIDELIEPTLNEDSNFLDSFRAINTYDSARIICKIIKLNEKLDEALDSDALEIDEDARDEEYVEDDVKMYAEETFDSLNKHRANIFQVTSEDLSENNICYLHGLLLALNKEFVDSLKQLTRYYLINVQVRTRSTLEKLDRFCAKISKESSEEWVEKLLTKLGENDLKRIEEEVEEELRKSGSTEDLNTNIEPRMLSDNVETMEDLRFEDEDLSEVSEEEDEEEERE